MTNIQENYPTGSDRQEEWASGSPGLKSPAGTDQVKTGIALNATLHFCFPCLKEPWLSIFCADTELQEASGGVENMATP